MTAALFLAFVAAVAAGVVAAAARYGSGRAAVAVAAGLAAWFACALAISLGDGAAAHPPRVGVPVAVFLVVFVVGFSGRVAAAVPLRLVLAAQAFRVGVELLLHRMWVDGVIPRTLTFAGANVDVYVAATAPLAAWVATRGRAGLWAAAAWNVAGLLALANVVARAVVAAPGPLHRGGAEVPNLMFGTAPYSLVPAFFVPVAVALHAVALRAIGRRLRAAPATGRPGEGGGLRQASGS